MICECDASNNFRTPQLYPENVNVRVYVCVLGVALEDGGEAVYAEYTQNIIAFP